MTDTGHDVAPLQDKVAPRRRERNKMDKRKRIKEAALALFGEKGYDLTTLPAVASKANVALGTLSLYAKDKRDLTLLVFSDSLDPLLERARYASTDADVGLVERLISFFEVYYREWGGNPTLSRIFLQLNYYAPGLHGEKYLASRHEVLATLEAMVREAMDRRLIATDVHPDVIAKYFFFVFSTSVRSWIAGDSPDVTAGLRVLKRLFLVQVEGLHPRKM